MSGTANSKVEEPAQHGDVGGGLLVELVKRLRASRAMALFRRHGYDATAFPCDSKVGPPSRNFAAIIPEAGDLEGSTAAIHE